LKFWTKKGGGRASPEGSSRPTQEGKKVHPLLPPEEGRRGSTAVVCREGRKRALSCGGKRYRPLLRKRGSRRKKDNRAPLTEKSKEGGR